MTYDVPEPQPAPTDPPAVAETAVPAPGASVRPGPGVVPPFVAPPREGVNRRRWIGAGIGAAIAVLCCGGGGIGIFGVLFSAEDHALSAASEVVTKYMDDKRDERFAAAYQLLCMDFKDRYTLTEFSSELVNTPITDFVVETPQADSGGRVIVPVSIDYAGGYQQTASYEVIQGSDGGSRICGGPDLAY
jgi:hypothetical protein